MNDVFESFEEWRDANEGPEYFEFVDRLAAIPNPTTRDILDWSGIVVPADEISRFRDDVLEDAFCPWRVASLSEGFQQDIAGGCIQPQGSTFSSIELFALYTALKWLVEPQPSPETVVGTAGIDTYMAD
jgi:hypothetical protein